MTVLPFEGTYPILYGSYGVPAGTGYEPGYLARPDRAGTFPAVIVLHDIFGLTSFEKDLCRRLARHGYVAVAIDLYRGAGPGNDASLDDAIAAYAAIRDERALEDIAEAHRFVLSDDVPWARKGPIGLVGTDIGGRFALLYAGKEPQVAGVVVGYAPFGGDDDRTYRLREVLPKLRVPILGLYGEADELIPVEDVDEALELAPHGRWLLYEGAGHFFLNDDMDGYDHAAWHDGLQRIFDFFAAVSPVGEPAVA